MHGKMQLILTTSFTPNFKAVWQHKAAIDFCTQNNGITIERNASCAIFKITKKKTFTVRCAFQNVEFH